MNIAYFDMDGSLFDYDSHLRASLEQLRSPCEPALEGNLHDMEVLPHMQARMDLIKTQPGWWLSMPVLVNGVLALNLAQEIGFECRILTKGPKSKTRAWREKIECCQRVFGPDIDVNIVSSKGETYGKVLYDDYIPFMESWLAHRPRGLGIMPVNEYNKDFTHPNVVKFDGNNLQQVRSALEAAFVRQPGSPLILEGCT